MPRKDIEFKTHDNVTLRGWLYTPSSGSGKAPCLVMAHGFSAVKEMDLDTFAEYFTSKLNLVCLVYDNRGFGSSDVKDGHPLYEINPNEQVSDYSDAITYAQTLPEVDADKIGVWGSSYSGGHVLVVGAIDRRVKIVLSQVPLVTGLGNFSALVRSDVRPQMDQMFMDDRLARFAHKDPVRIPVVDENPQAPSALPTSDSYQFFQAWGKKSPWKNDVTLKSMEMLRAYEPVAYIHRISPTPLLMTVERNDVLTPSQLALDAYSKALEPKQLQILPGGHFDAYSGPTFESNAGTQAEFLKKHLGV
ncbi:alpha/beta-hydrolase [Rhizodiscina lignyota]|uniref:Alpha/beta-hydrolase n=1 Tax=Rhizodiscina lignyota TaxID=1504668 RepID=A0A9P4M2B1_9PEZI|nr:alpha/beta-hydrolase [Rhizodiscina lignyota]